MTHDECKAAPLAELAQHFGAAVQRAVAHPLLPRDAAGALIVAAVLLERLTADVDTLRASTMKTKIGQATCFDCGYTDCDVGLDRNGHPYLVCWGDACAGEQYFTKGKPAKVARLLTVYRPLAGKPTADALRLKYALPAAEPAPAPSSPAAEPAPPKAKRNSGLLIPD